MIRVKPTPLEKSSCGQSAEVRPNLPKGSIQRQEINVDNEARFRYLNNYWFRLVDASICCAAAETDAQLLIFA